jgi:hypothetical protein
MVHLFRSLSVAALALSLAPAARSQSLVQLRFSGAIEEARRVSLEVVALVEAKPRKVDVAFTLAAGTTGKEAAALVSRRLERGGFDVLHAQGESADSVFVEGTRSVAVRSSGRLSISVTTCEGPPAAVRVESLGADAGATLALAVKTHSAPRDETGGVDLSVLLDAGANAPSVASLLVDEAAAQDLLSEKARGEAWRPLKMRTGAPVVGLSVALQSAGDWRLVVELVES